MVRIPYKDAETAPPSRRLGRVFRDWQTIDRDGGPGTESNGRGSWHVFCHLAAAAGVLRIPDIGCAWAGILHDPSGDRYFSAICMQSGRRFEVHPLPSPAAARLLERGEWCGFIEGASRGHILNRVATDAGDPDMDDRRQDYDQNPNSPKDGGPVWEMWTVSRDIRPSSPLGSSLVEAYAELLSVLGGRFAAVVARGRMEPEYGHLRQMCAMIDAGFIRPEEALTDIDAVAIPPDVERILLEATPEAFATAAEMLVRKSRKPCYWMYSRKVSSFATASLLRRLVRTLSPGVTNSPKPRAQAKAKSSRNRRH